MSDLAGDGQIFLMDAEGRNQHAITSGNSENAVPTWSRDGASLYYTSNRTGEDQIWKRELATGRETEVTHHGGLAATESVNGKTLYFSKRDGGGIWSLPVAGGEEQHVTPLLQQGYWGYFGVTESGIYLVDSEEKGGPMIKFYDFATRQMRPVLPLK